MPWDGGQLHFPSDKHVFLTFCGAIKLFELQVSRSVLNFLCLCTDHELVLLRRELWLNKRVCHMH